MAEDLSATTVLADAEHRRNQVAAAFQLAQDENTKMMLALKKKIEEKQKVIDVNNMYVHRVENEKNESKKQLVAARNKIKMHEKSIFTIKLQQKDQKKKFDEERVKMQEERVKMQEAMQAEVDRVSSELGSVLEKLARVKDVVG
eukprot:g6074.t1